MQNLNLDAILLELKISSKQNLEKKLTSLGIQTSENKLTSISDYKRLVEHYIHNNRMSEETRIAASKIKERIEDFLLGQKAKILEAAKLESAQLDKVEAFVLGLIRLTTILWMPIASLFKTLSKGLLMREFGMFGCLIAIFYQMHHSAALYVRYELLASKVESNAIQPSLFMAWLFSFAFEIVALGVTIATVRKATAKGVEPKKTTLALFAVVVYFVNFLYFNPLSFEGGGVEWWGNLFGVNVLCAGITFAHFKLSDLATSV